MDIFNNKAKKLQEFLKMLTKLDAAEFLGICKILGVPIMNGDDPVEFDTMLEGVIDGFVNMKKSPRNQLLKLMREVIKSKGDKDGTQSEN